MRLYDGERVGKVDVGDRLGVEVGFTNEGDVDGILDGYEVVGHVLEGNNVGVPLVGNVEGKEMDGKVEGDSEFEERTEVC